MVSNELEDGFTSDWVGITGITGGGENNQLPSLRNAWGECRGVTGGVANPSAKGSQVCPVKDTQVGEDHSP